MREFYLLNTFKPIKLKDWLTRDVNYIKLHYYYTVRQKFRVFDIWFRFWPQS